MQVLLTLALASLSLSTPIPTRDPGSTLGPVETLDNQTPAFDVRYIGDDIESAGASSNLPDVKRSSGEELIDVAARASVTVGQGGANAIGTPDDMQRANVIVAPGARRNIIGNSLDGASAQVDSREEIDLHKRTEDSKGGISFTTGSGEAEPDLSRTGAYLVPHDGFQKERRKEERSDTTNTKVTLNNRSSGAYRHARDTKGQDRRLYGGPSPDNDVPTARSSTSEVGLGESKRSAQATQDGWTGYPDSYTTEQHGSMDDKRYEQRSSARRDAGPTQSVPDWDNTAESEDSAPGDVIWLTRARDSRGVDGNVDVQTKDKRTAEGVSNRERFVIRRPGNTLEVPRPMARRTRDPDEVPASSYEEWVRRLEERHGSGENVARRDSKRLSGSFILSRKSVPNWDNTYPGDLDGPGRRTDDYQGKGTDSAIQMSGRMADGYQETEADIQTRSAPNPVQKLRSADATTGVDRDPDGWGADWNDGLN